MENHEIIKIASFIFLISFFPINTAFAQQQELVELYPWQSLQRNHSLIIDINEPEGQLSGDLTVTVIPDLATAQPNDSLTITPEFDREWGKYRVIIATSDTENKILTNLVLEAEPGEFIVVNYPGVTLEPIEVKDIDSTIGEGQAFVPSGDRWTYGVDLKSGSCPGQLGGDEDKDGICDEWEQGDSLVISKNPMGTYTFDCGEMRCDNSQKDIFVEIDYMDSHNPDPKALKQVQDAFANYIDPLTGKGINLHIQVDSEPAFQHMQGIYWPGEDTPQGDPGFDQIKGENFGTATERFDDYPNDWDEVKKLKFQVFHYAFFAHVNWEDLNGTGIGEILGNDFLVTLGKLSGKTGSADQQAGTFMHELGHNFALNHGGGTFDVVNNKPNLYSVMTYTRQLSDYDGNRNLDYSSLALGHHHSEQADLPMGLDEDLLQGYAQGIFSYPGHDDEPIIFSCPDGTVSDLGDYPGVNGGVDWNCNNIPEETGYHDPPININDFPSDPSLITGEQLDGHDDWGTLNYYFSTHAGNFEDGRGASVNEPDRVTSKGTELNLEKVTLNRISSLLALYRQIDEFKETDFASGFDESVPGEVRISQGTSVPGCETTNGCYFPYEIIVNVGDEVSWFNDDTAAHTVTGGSSADGLSGEFDSGLFMAGAVFSYTFDGTGTFDYFCMVHPWMIGAVTVQQGGNTGNPVTGEPKKESFKDGVVNVIDSINFHDIPKAKNELKELQGELIGSLNSNSNDKIVNKMINNLFATYERALGFGVVSSNDRVDDAIVNKTKIGQMIDKIEKFVANSQSKGLQCFAPTHKVGNTCECYSHSTFNSEFDCVLGGTVVFPPLIQVQMGVSATDVECNSGLELIIDGDGDPACVKPLSKIKLVTYGWTSN